MANKKKPARKEQRIERGEAIEETDFMKALEDDPAAAMMSLADECEASWKKHAGKNAGQITPENEGE